MRVAVLGDNDVVINIVEMKRLPPNDPKLVSGLVADIGLKYDRGSDTFSKPVESTQRLKTRLALALDKEASERITRPYKAIAEAEKNKLETMTEEQLRSYDPVNDPRWPA